MLSYGARLVLIKSVLSSLPTYHLSLFKAPSRVIGTIEKIQRRFLWEGTADHKSFHWVDWSSVKCPIAKGGLGILDIKTYNEALLGKWLWRYATEKRAWWRTLIVQKYGIGSSDWLPSSDFGSSSLSVWIRISQFGSSFWRFTSIDPGGGYSAFWSDFWVLGERLSDRYPRILAADAKPPGSRIFDYLSADRCRWCIPLRFTLRGGANLEFQSLLAHLDALPDSLITEGPDAIIWPDGKDQLFTVSSFRNLLLADRFPGSCSFPAKEIWSRLAPTKVQFFCWLVYRNRIATIDNLQRRGLALPNRCALCEMEAESVNHLFIHCSFSSQVWSKLSSTLSIHGPLPSSFGDFLRMWKDVNCSLAFSTAKKVLFHSFIWHLWLERNDRTFREIQSSSHQVFVRLWLAIARWLHAFGNFDDNKRRDWVRLCFDNG
ncbi:Putative ribonuclease H protein At1g65750 [Linum perenne]